MNEDEKVIAVERLRENRTGVANKEFKRYQLMEAFKDPLVYYSFFYAISCVVPNSGVSFVSPSTATLSPPQAKAHCPVRRPNHQRNGLQQLRLLHPPNAIRSLRNHRPPHIRLPHPQNPQHALHEPIHLVRASRLRRCPSILSPYVQPRRSPSWLLLHRILQRGLTATVLAHEFECGGTYEAECR